MAAKRASKRMLAVPVPKNAHAILGTREGDSLEVVHAAWAAAREDLRDGTRRLDAAYNEIKTELELAAKQISMFEELDAT